MGQTRPVAIGPLVAGFAALVLIGSLFADWYEPGVSAWTVFETLDLVLAALALATIAVAAQGLGAGLPMARLPDTGGAEKYLTSRKSRSIGRGGTALASGKDHAASARLQGERREPL